jgi:hypothetical protein
MSAMIIWILGIAIGIAALVVTASMKLYYVHMGVAAIVSIFMALAAYADNRTARAAQVPENEIASLNARFMGAVWSWGALSMLVTYLFVLSWREWWQYVIVFAGLACVCLFFASLLSGDKTANRGGDETMLKLARNLAMAQLVGAGIVMLGLLIDGKMWRFKTAAGQRVGWEDWAANNIFFFGAMALAAISWLAVQLRPVRQ